MILRWLYNKMHPGTPTSRPSTPETRNEAREAVERASHSLEEANSRNGEVAKVTKALRIQRERNHFAELLEGSMRGNG